MVASSRITPNELRVAQFRIDIEPLVQATPLPITETQIEEQAALAPVGLQEAALPIQVVAPVPAVSLFTSTPVSTRAMTRTARKKRDVIVKRKMEIAPRDSSAKADINKNSSILTFLAGKNSPTEERSTAQNADDLLAMAKQSGGLAGVNDGQSRSDGSERRLKETGGGGADLSLRGLVKEFGDGSKRRRQSVNAKLGGASLGLHREVRIATHAAKTSYSGTIDREAIRKIIQGNLRAIRSCYEQALNRKSGLYGKIVLAWDIGEQGRVTAVKLRSNNLGSEEVAQCVMNHLQTLRFPEPPNRQTVEVTYPFLFSN